MSRISLIPDTRQEERVREAVDDLLDTMTPNQTGEVYVQVWFGVDIDTVWEAQWQRDESYVVDPEAVR